MALVDAAHEAGLKVYTPPWETVSQAEKLPTSVQADANIKAIAGRSGWGTGWRTMQLAKPWLVAEYEKGDDPEIFFNNKTITALNLGRVIGASSISGSVVQEIIDSATPALTNLREQIAHRFGTANGLSYMADRIFANLFGT